MKYHLDIEKFKQYFHYGLQYNQDEILDAVIISTSQSMHKIKFEKLGTQMNRLEYTLDAIKQIYVQFERFINLVASDNLSWYPKVTKASVNDVIMERIRFLHDAGLISVIDRELFYGIYTNDRGTSKAYGGMTGVQRYESLPGWIREDIVPILRHLAELEQENPYQYESLFMDTKYARSVNSGKWESSEKLRIMYRIFEDKARLPKSDIYAALGPNVSIDDKEYIDENYIDYWTITDLKEQAKTDSYRQRIYEHCEIIRSREGICR